MWPMDVQGGPLSQNAFSSVRTEQMGPMKVQGRWCYQNGSETFRQQQMWPMDVQGGSSSQNAFSSVMTGEKEPMKVQGGWGIENDTETFQQRMWPGDVRYGPSSENTLPDQIWPMDVQPVQCDQNRLETYEQQQIGVNEIRNDPSSQNTQMWANDGECGQYVQNDPATLINEGQEAVVTHNSASNDLTGRSTIENSI